MPTYEYRCGECGHELEAVQSFSDPALTECPNCGKPALRKLFGNVGVVFKGSGFYRNDSRNDGKPASKTATPAASKTAKESGSTDSGSSSAATPAEKKSTPKKDSAAAKPKS
ncbi:MAG: FmdB family zinc ribbon protein [Candidatus Nanopelagicales bacterium]